MQNQPPINNPDRVDNMSLVECPDQAEGLHPFTAAVMRAPMPENKVLPAMEQCGGSTDPVKHVDPSWMQWRYIPRMISSGVELFPCH